MCIIVRIFKSIIILVLFCVVPFISCSSFNENDKVKDQILIAKNYAELRQYGKAEMELKHAISMSRKIHGANDVTEGLCYLKLIYILLNLDKPLDAESAVDHAWSIFNQYGKVANRKQLQCIAGEAAVFSYREQYAQAESLLQYIVKSYTILSENDLQFYYYITNFQASAIKAQGRFYEADSIYNLTISEINKSDNDDDEYLISAYLGLSSIAIKQDSLEKSERILDSLQLIYPKLNDNFPSQGSTLNFHRSIINYRKFNINPTKQYSKSIECMRKYYGESNYNIKQICLWLSRDFKFYGLDNIATLYKLKSENIKIALDEGRNPSEEDLNLLVDWTEFCQE